MQHDYICQRILIEDCAMDVNDSEQKLTQTQRREKTRGALLASACVFFGERGYAATSLEDIAEDCGLTIRPIYYHFGSKRELFRAVNAVMEQQAMQALDCQSVVEAWQRFETLCEDCIFRRVILVDAPNVVGRQRWTGAKSLPWCDALAPEIPGVDADMRARIALAALSQAAIVVAEAGHDVTARDAASQLISILLQETAGDSNSTLQAQGR